MQQNKIISIATLFSLAISYSASAYACKIPKSFYKHVSCTSNSRYFLASKDSGHPVAIIGKNGKRVVNLMGYDRVDAFNLRGGLLPVNRGRKIGYMNMSGKLVIPLIYEPIGNTKSKTGWARPASNNRIVVKKQGKLGIIDTNNGVVLPFSASYKAISDYTAGITKVTKTNEVLWFDINARKTANPNAKPTNISASNTTKSLEEKPTVTFDGYVLDKDQAATLVADLEITNSSNLPTTTNDGYIFSADEADEIIAKTNSAKLKRINKFPRTKKLRDEAITIITNSNNTNNDLLQTNDINIKLPERDEVWEATEKDGHWGFVDRNGVPMINFAFSEVTPFSEGLAGVRIDDKWGFVDLAGELHIPFRFHDDGVNKNSNDTYYGAKPFVFNQGKAWVGSFTDSTKMCINLKGENDKCD